MGIVRRSEALGVRWSRINWEERTVWLSTKIIDKKENGKKVAVPVDIMKNKKSRRTMPNPDVVYEMLLEQKEKQEIRHLEVRGVFNHRKGRFYGRKTVYERLPITAISAHINTQA